MYVPRGLVLFLFLIAFVLGALCYYKSLPERVVLSVPFWFMSAPLMLFVVFLAMTSRGTALPALWSGGFLLLALVVLGATVFRVRRLFGKER